MPLRSSMMNLSSFELAWLPWFGKTGKLSMAFACRLNRGHYAYVGKTFGGIADLTANQLHLVRQFLVRGVTA